MLFAACLVSLAAHYHPNALRAMVITIRDRNDSARTTETTFGFQVPMPAVRWVAALVLRRFYAVRFA